MATTKYTKNKPRTTRTGFGHKRKILILRVFKNDYVEGTTAFSLFPYDFGGGAAGRFEAQVRK